MTMPLALMTASLITLALITLALVLALAAALGILLVLPALTLISVATMVLAGWGVSVFQLGQNGHVYTQLVIDNVGVLELSVSVVKALIFGVIVSLVCCYNGYYSKPGPEGVGSATNMAVVTAAISCMFVNYLVSEMVYG